MAMIERYVLLEYEGINYEFHNYEDSDIRAVLTAIKSLERKLGKMQGALKGYFKNRPDLIVVKFWGGK